MRAKRRAFLAPMAAMALALAFVAPAFSFVPMLARPSSGSPQNARWDVSIPLKWNLNPDKGANIQGARSLADVITASFATWMAAPNTALTVTRGPDQPGTTTVPSSSSGVNLICFVCQDAELKDPKTLAVTLVTISDTVGQNNGHGGVTTFVGQIVAAPILFNTAVTWSTDGAPGAQDLQTVATHEIGHFFGLDHSGVVRSMMFPAAPDVQHAISYDDVAGISTLYPKAGAPGACNAGADVPTGCISGMVRTASGLPVFGAHVYADSTTAAHPLSSAVRKSPIGTLSGPDGSYTIRNAPVDSYIVIAEPLDSPMTNADVPDFGKAFGRGAVQTNFTTRWH